MVYAKPNTLNIELEWRLIYVTSNFVTILVIFCWISGNFERER